MATEQDKTHAEFHELEVLRKLIRGRMEDYADDVAGGAARDFADYRYWTGVIAGLAFAERELLDLDSRMVRDEQ